MRRRVYVVPANGAVNISIPDGRVVVSLFFGSTGGVGLVTLACADWTVTIGMSSSSPILRAWDGVGLRPVMRASQPANMQPISVVVDAMDGCDVD